MTQLAAGHGRFQKAALVSGCAAQAAASAADLDLPRDDLLLHVAVSPACLFVVANSAYLSIAATASVAARLFETAAPWRVFHGACNVYVGNS